MKAITPIRAKIKKKNKDFADKIKIIDGIDNGISHPGKDKDEYKYDIVGSFLKKIKSDLQKEECEKTESIVPINEIIDKFNDISERITQVKEDFD